MVRIISPVAPACPRFHFSSYWTRSGKAEYWGTDHIAPRRQKQMDDFAYPDPVQAYGDQPVTRQRGLDPTQQPMSRDPQPPQKIVQGDAEVVAYRNPGGGSQFFGGDGTLYSDSRADDNTLYADRALIASGETMPPPGIERTNVALPPSSGFGDMPAAQQREAVKAAAIAAGFVVSEAKDSPTAFGVIASDGGSADPRDRGGAPMVFTAGQLPVIRKTKIVPVLISAPKVRRVRAQKVGK
jgi:hypothetical protein